MPTFLSRYHNVMAMSFCLSVCLVVCSFVHLLLEMRPLLCCCFVGRSTDTVALPPVSHIFSTP